MPRPAPGDDRWTAFLAHFLFVLAAWTVFIKYLFPLAFAAADGAPPTRWIYWDLWPIAHVWLGWALLAQPDVRDRPQIPVDPSRRRRAFGHRECEREQVLDENGPGGEYEQKVGQECGP